MDIHSQLQTADFVVIGISYWSKGPKAKEFTDWVPKYDEVIKKAGAQTVITAPWPDQHDVDTVHHSPAVADGLARLAGPAFPLMAPFIGALSNPTYSVCPVSQAEIPRRRTDRILRSINLIKLLLYS